MRRNLSRMLAILMMLSVISAIGICPKVSAADPVTITIGHTNDVHGRNSYNESEGTIGFAKAKTLFEDTDLLFDAGDFFHGKAFATLEKGDSMAQLMNAMGYTAMTLGNHDWNYGQEKLLDLEKLSEVPILASNVMKADGSNFFSQPYIIKDVKGVKVGVFGVIDPDVYSGTTPSVLQGITYEDPIKYGNLAVDELKSQGADVIICLSHCSDYESIANGINGMDVMITGHLHQQIDKIINGALVVQAKEHTELLGKITLKYSIEEKRVINKEENFITFGEAQSTIEDCGITEIIDEINSRQAPILNEVVGYSDVELVGDKLIVRKEETNLGRVVTDSYIYETGADIAFENGGAIRSTIYEGDITRGDIISVSPFGKQVVTKQMTGEAVVNCLELSIEQGLKNTKAYATGSDPGEDGYYLQVGGIKVEYDTALQEGDRVKNVTVGDEPIDLDKSYVVAVNNYIINFDFYPDLYDAPTVNEYHSCEEVITNYVSVGGITESYDKQRMFDVTVNNNEKASESEQTKGVQIDNSSSFYFDNWDNNLEEAILPNWVDSFISLFQLNSSKELVTILKSFINLY